MEFTYEQLVKFQAKLVCERPNENLEKWEASIQFAGVAGVTGIVNCG